MKIATVLGTRPEIIRLSRVIEKLDGLAEHVLIHTGQNYDPNLNDIFFRDLGVRAPNYYLVPREGISASRWAKFSPASSRCSKKNGPIACSF